MEIKTTLLRLQVISFAAPETESLLDRLYHMRPERGGAKVVYRVAALRAAVVRLLGPDSAFESTRQKLMEQHADNRPALISAIDELSATEVTFDGELVALDQLDAAGYALSAAELDALTGLLIQPEVEPVAPTA